MRRRLVNKYRSGKNQLTLEYEEYYEYWDTGRLLGGFVLGIFLGFFLVILFGIFVIGSGLADYFWGYSHSLVDAFLSFILFIFTIALCMYLVGQKEKTRVVSETQYMSEEDLENYDYEVPQQKNLKELKESMSKKEWEDYVLSAKIR
ncbi:MAG: hypothetical protein LBC39_07650 [Methanobrevibacter sp.]|jgi:hypothetical protein|nr:hypothetical protein [Candidatus Methanovirga aequatorialis]